MTVVLDLASRFADGRLSNQKLAQADDEELAKLLIEVRGIGRVRCLLLDRFDFQLFYFVTPSQWTGEFALKPKFPLLIRSNQWTCSPYFP